MHPTDQEIIAGRNCRLEHRSTCIPGVSVIEFTHSNWATVIGHLWYRWTGNATIEILDVYVMAKARRLGIANRLLLDLKQSFPKLVCLTTESANDMSKPWLQKAGFQLWSDGDWRLLLKTVRPVILKKGKR